MHHTRPVQSSQCFGPVMPVRPSLCALSISLYPCMGHKWPSAMAFDPWSPAAAPASPSGTDVKRDIHLVVLLLLVIGCSLASLTLWKVMASRKQALEDIDTHSLNLTQALATYSEGIVRQSSLLLLGLVERLETEGSGPAQIERLTQLVSRLQRVAKVLATCIRRPSDLLARYGGEEMAVILPDTDSVGVAAVAQLMLERLAHETIDHPGSPFGRVTISIGASNAPGAQLDGWQSLLAAADQALYCAKDAGRDCLHVGECERIDLPT